MISLDPPDLIHVEMATAQYLPKSFAFSNSQSRSGHQGLYHCTSKPDPKKRTILKQAWCHIMPLNLLIR